MHPGELLALLDEPWKQDAACKGMTELFYPDPLDENLDDIIEECQVVCAGCPVRELCDEYATNRPEEFGIWAGINREVEYE
jgi:WhiB family redox-sensing transcriptional regulator